MRILKAEVKNFGSFVHLEFDFSNKGLALIHGATGSGKSTLQDIPVWILYGATAKDGNVDEIRNWNNLDKVTSGILDVEISPGNVITVCRTRGKGAQNDLYWIDTEGTLYRGKDVSETQKLLENYIGVSKDVYIASSYYNEFSPSGNFFVSKAKDRRDLLEKLADLEVPTALTERVTHEKRKIKKEIDSSLSQYNQKMGRYSQLKAQLIDSEKSCLMWDEIQKNTLQKLKIKADSFEADKSSKIRQIEAKISEFQSRLDIETKELVEKIKHLEDHLTRLDEKCDKCGTQSKEFFNKKATLVRYLDSLQNLQMTTNPHPLLLEDVKSLKNPYIEQINLEASKSNLFISQLDNIKKDISALELELKSDKELIDAREYRLAALTQLNDLIQESRGVIVTNAIRAVERRTNELLDKYFDSEFRVEFIIDSGDSLDVSIYKNSIPCVFKQLSKGQRALLKLCFSVSVMKAASNKTNNHFSLLCFDEALDGLDTDLKLKAFNLFSELEKNHETVLVVEHNNELKSLFYNKYYVVLDNDASTIVE